MKQPLKKLNML